jgi:Carboxypeptidase regulatory-like domain/TonB dependent receptor-like, beta-barrel/TonB-dependent Receptor Plug Domain
MSRLAWCARTALIVVLFLVPVPRGADAQSAASISGVVKDTEGAVMPGVSVVIKNDTSGASQEVTTDGEGRYQVTALGAGSYTVTATLSGFKVATSKNIRVAPGQPVSIPLTLEIGQLEETVVVTSSSELINTENGTVAATLNSDQLTRMPTATRNALNAVAFLPGVNTTGTNRDSTINGLPENFLSITLDGVSNNDNFLRNTDGFFASVTPRQDAVEAVSVTLSAAGAQVGGGAGAVTMAFQTRSGGNRFTGSAYEYYRNPDFNTNYVFNEINHQPKNDVKLNQFGARAGGPIMIPGLYDGRDKAFFFVHYEQIRFPNSFTRTRTVFNPRVYDGWFRYQFGSEVREVNLLQLAARNGQISAMDPTSMSLQAKIDAATKTAGTRAAQSDPLYDNYVWQSPSELFEHQPTVRLDYNLTDNHRLNGSYSTITAKRTPDYLNNADPRFPGAPNQRDFVSKRPLMATSLRSLIGKNMVNELRGGLTAFASGSNFGYPSSVTSRNDPGTFADSGGFAITTPGNTTDWFTSNTPSWRKAPTYSIEDTLTWNKGAHTILTGGNVFISNASSSGQTMVRGIGLGFNQDFDPAAGLFNTTNFPGASSDQLTAARNTYAVLTGRVTSVTSTAVLQSTGQYEELAPSTLEGGYNVYGMFAQDTWRLKPNLTLTGGLRYDIQTPFTPFTSVMSAVTMDSVCGRSGLGDGGLYSKCNFLDPGSLGGVTPNYILLEKGSEGYKTDLNNVAPSASIAWQPNVESGFLSKILGDPAQATIRAGYSMAYAREGLTRFTGLYGDNRGASISLTRNASTGLVPAGESWPVLLSQTSRLYPLPFNPDPTYPIAVGANRADNLNAFTPDIQIARVQTWTVGFARSISNSMAFEIRYIGNRGDNEWSSINYNCGTTNQNNCTGIRGENLVANGFLNEFKLAMANLQANNASGVASRVGSFAYFGSGTGTNPLPVYLAYLNGRTDAGNPAAYGLGANGQTINPSTTYANSAIAGRLAGPNPNPNGAAADLDYNLTRRNQAQAAGYPANFFILNPDVNFANVVDSGAFSKYNALQLELRRRLSKGFSANLNYQYAFEGGSQFDGFSYGRAWTDVPVTGNPTVRHALKFQADWMLPFGRGERFGTNMNPVLNVLASGWSITSVGRFQTTVTDLGNVRLVGMSVDDLQGMYKFYRKENAATGIDEVWMLPDDVVLNTRRAFSTSNATVSGYSTGLGAPEGRYIAPANSADCIQVRAGDCAPRSVLLLTPWFKRVDLGVMKKIDIGGTRNVELRFDLLNVFDNPNYNPVGATGTNTAAGTSATIFRTTAAYTDASNTYDPGGRIGQLMIRFNW